MKPGPKPLPGTVHYLRGNHSKKPASALLDAVVPRTEISDPPEHLDEVALAEWRRLGPELARLGLVSQVDRAAQALYCSAWSHWVQAENKLRELGDDGLIGRTPNGFKQMGVWLMISNRAAEQVHKFMTEFGMSPSSRSRVSAGDPQTDLFEDDDPGDSGSSGPGRPAHPRDYLSR